MSKPISSIVRVITLLLVSVSLASAQSPAWRALPNAPVTHNRMDDVHFINPSMGWMVSNPACGGGCDGYTGVWHTSDGGASWVLQFKAAEYLRSVGFLDSLRGFVGTVFNDNQVLYRTNDGGKSWALVSNLPPSPPLGVCGISVVNDSVMFASGRFYGPPRALKTTNRGLTWTAMDLSAHAGALVDCYFKSKDSGFVVGSTDGNYVNGMARVLFTSDGGTTWATRYAGTRVGELCWKIQFLTPTIAYVSIEKFSSGTTYYLKSTDAGVTWNDQVFQNFEYDVQGIGFASDSLGWLGGWGGDTYETSDGGSSWHLAGFGYILNRFRFLNPSLAYAVGQTVFKYSIDSVEALWKTQSSGTFQSLAGVSFVNANTGTAVGDNGTILRTTDGGLNWTGQTSGTGAHLRAVSFIDANTGTAVGTGGTILRTTNGGSSWASQISGTFQDLHCVAFTSALVGSAAGNAGTILRTTDGGLNWTPQTSGTGDPLYAMSFVDASTGTAVGGVGIILRTTNGGATWSPQASGTSFDLRGVSFTHSDTGTAVGLNGTILRTTNGGVAWSAQSSLLSDEILAVSFKNSAVGLAVGRFGIILRTTDGGANWNAYSSGTFLLFRGVDFADGQTASIVGPDGTILRATGLGSCSQAIVSGDVNASGQITSADVINLVNYTFKSGPPPLPIAEAGDVNCDHTLTSADIIRLVNYVFKSGAEPCDVCALP